MRRGMLAVAVLLAGCGGGGSSGVGPAFPNAQEANLVVVTNGLTPGGALGVDNRSGDDVIELWFKGDTAPPALWVDAFLGDGGFIPDGSGWAYPGDLPAGLWDIQAWGRDGGYRVVTFAYEPGFSDAWVLD